MKLNRPQLLSLLLCIFGGVIQVQAADSNWKKGRIYYRMVCTACHKDNAGGSISPATMTRAEWNAYIGTDKHAKGMDMVSYYVSKKYRNIIKDSNRAAAKFVDIANEIMLADVQAFVIHGAKDSDTPASCN